MYISIMGFYADTSTARPAFANNYFSRARKPPKPKLFVTLAGQTAYLCISVSYGIPMYTVYISILLPQKRQKERVHNISN